MPRRKKPAPRPLGTKWAEVHDLLGQTRDALRKGKYPEAVKLAEQALGIAGKWCHRADRARSMGLTIERSIRETILEPLQATDHTDEKDYVLGAIDFTLDIIQREAGMAIYKAQQRREVDALVVGFVDAINKSINDSFNKMVQEAMLSFADPRKKKRRSR